MSGMVQGGVLELRGGKVGFGSGGCKGWWWICNRMCEGTFWVLQRVNVPVGLEWGT